MKTDARTLILTAIALTSLLLVGVSAATASSDVGAGYLAYKAYNDDLDADSALAGGSAVLSGSGAAASGAGTYVTASGTAATLGSGAAATGGALAL